MIRVRWKEWGGWEPWIVATRVSLTDGWLVIRLPDNGWIYVPNHNIRGRVEVVPIPDEEANTDDQHKSDADAALRAMRSAGATP